MGPLVRRNGRETSFQNSSIYRDCLSSNLCGWQIGPRLCASPSRCAWACRSHRWELHTDHRLSRILQLQPRQGKSWLQLDKELVRFTTTMVKVIDIDDKFMWVKLFDYSCARSFYEVKKPFNEKSFNVIER